MTSPKPPDDRADPAPALGAVARGEDDDGARGFAAEYLGSLLGLAHQSFTNQFRPAVRAAGLRVPEWRILASLSDRTGATVTELARLTLYEQPRVTKTLMQLEHQGLVRRRSDPDDRRLVRAYVTARGRAVVEPLIERARAHEEATLRRVPAEHRAILKGALRAIALPAEAARVANEDELPLERVGA